MTKSTITREQLLEIIETDHVQCGEASYLARMALAAMDSEPVAYIFKHPAGRLFWSLTDESNKGHDDVMPVYDSPQSPDSEPATVPGKWIPVSERMPLTPSADCEYSDIEVNVFDGERVFTAHYATGSQPHPCGYWVDTYAKITHWQHLPAAPQEVK